MRCTEEERENYRRRKREEKRRGTFWKIISKATKYIAGLAITIIIGLLLRFIYFKVGTEIAKSHAEQAKNVVSSLQIQQKINPNHQQISINQQNQKNEVLYTNPSERIIQKPINQYMNDYVFKEMRENALRREQERRKATEVNTTPNNKIADIKQSSKKNPDTWQECEPYQREGHDYSKNVILCKDGKTVVIPIR